VSAFPAGDLSGMIRNTLKEYFLKKWRFAEEHTPLIMNVDGHLTEALGMERSSKEAINGSISTSISQKNWIYKKFEILLEMQYFIKDHSLQKKYCISNRISMALLLGYLYHWAQKRLPVYPLSCLCLDSFPAPTFLTIFDVMDECLKPEDCFFVKGKIPVLTLEEWCWMTVSWMWIVTV
jgi:hypothetical protein